jgi:capsular polysaccharide export protein
MPSAQRLTFYCGSHLEFGRYQRLRPAFEQCGYTVGLVTHLFTIGLRARRAGLSCTVTRRVGDTACPDLSDQPTPEVALGLAPPAFARRFQNSVWDALERNARSFAPDVIVQWNGMSLAGRVVTAFARATGVPLLYFELGNIEPKLFVDVSGVNAAARIASHPDELERAGVTDQDLEPWIGDLIARRVAMTRIPQAAPRIRINPWFPIDFFAQFVAAIPAPNNLGIVRRLAEKLSRLAYRPPPNIRPDRPYVLLPLQVSKDSNLLLFSNGFDNLKALAFARDRARTKGLSLVVKPHPAETNIRLLAEITRVCGEHGILMTSANVTQLLIGCEEVITINSTVGLEAMLIGKPVTVLGQSLYAGMTRRQIALFAKHRLVDFAPYGRAPATPDAARQILAMAKPETPAS